MHEFLKHMEDDAHYDDELTRWVVEQSRKNEKPAGRAATPQEIGAAISQATAEADAQNEDDPTLIQRLLKHGEVSLLLGLFAVGGATVFFTSEVGQHFLRKIQGQ